MIRLSLTFRSQLAMDIQVISTRACANAPVAQSPAARVNARAVRRRGMGTLGVGLAHSVGARPRSRTGENPSRPCRSCRDEDTRHAMAVKLARMQSAVTPLFRFDNTYARDLVGLAVPWRPAQVPSPRLVFL